MLPMASPRCPSHCLHALNRMKNSDIRNNLHLYYYCSSRKWLGGENNGIYMLCHSIVCVVTLKLCVVTQSVS